MTLQAVTRKAGPFSGNGVTTSFPFSFQCTDRTFLRVVRTSSAGVDANLTLDTHYSVALNANQETNPGGTVTYPLSGSPLPNGETLTVLGSAAPASQTTDLTNGGGFFPETIEQRLDYITMLVQQHDQILARAVRGPATDLLDISEMPHKANRAGKFMVFDANGHPTVSTGSGGGDTSLRTDLANGAAGPGSNLVAIPRTAAEIAIGVTPSSYLYAEGVVDRYIPNGANSAQVRQAINDAINVMEQKGGGVVRLLARRYTYSGGAITHKADVSIIGEGQGSILEADNCDGIAITEYPTFHNVCFEKFVLKGINGTTRRGLTADASTNMNDQPYGFVFRDMLIEDFNVGVHLRTIRNFLFNKVWIQDVDRAVELVGLCLLGWFNNCMFVRGNGNGAGANRGVYIDTYTYAVGGTQPPEGLRFTDMQVYGFNTAFRVAFCNSFVLNGFDIDARVRGIEFVTGQFGFDVTNGFINMVNTAATDAIYGDSLGSAITTHVSIKNVSILCSSVAAGTCHGIRINSGGATNQFNVHIESCDIHGATLYDILLNNPGHSSVRNNYCAGTGVTKSIKIGTVQAGIVRVEGNRCAGNIETVSADAIAGKVRCVSNIVGGTNYHSADSKDWYEEGTWTPSDGSGAGLTFSSPTGTYTRIGNLVIARFALSYPSTANGANAQINGLPYTVKNAQEARQGFVTFTTEGTLEKLLPEANNTFVSPRTAAGANITNATLSLDSVYGMAIYSIA